YICINGRSERGARGALAPALYTPEGEEEAFEEIEREGSMMIAQRGSDLGERLGNCFIDLFGLGFESVIVIGADTPTLPGELVYDAFDSLEDGRDVIIGPTEDGGFYLIGMRKFHRRIFEEIPWGTDGVLFATTDRVKQIGGNLILMPDWYDVDTPADLERLKCDLSESTDSARFTRGFLKQMAKHKSE